MSATNKVYLLYFDWVNTSGNHAGMSYLCKSLEKEIPQVRAIKLISSRKKAIRVLNIMYLSVLFLWFLFKLKKNDKVFLMEYMARGSFQTYFAFMHHLLRIKYELIGLVHLSGAHLEELYKVNAIRKALNYPDRIMTFGSSLAQYIKSLDAEIDVILTYHYVDDEFYKAVMPAINEKLKVICVGNIKRDFTTLKQLIVELPAVEFHVCQGTKNLKPLLGDQMNVVLYPFLTEKELLRLMQSCDISLSIITDTIGSNVITTSMACGLVQVVSDVGSIRDYCTEEDTCFCAGFNDYKKYIEKLRHDPILLHNMKISARNRSALFSLKNFTSYFRSSFCYE